MNCSWGCCSCRLAAVPAHDQGRFTTLTLWGLYVLQTSLLGELRQLGAAISQDIYQESPNVKWSDIAGLTEAKR